jgi:O-antigen/teichoic acid export membrane protein
LPILVAQSLFPAIISAQKVNKSHYYNRLQLFYDLMTWLGIAIALPTSLAASGLVNLLFGEQYIKAGFVLSIYAWTGVFVFLGVANGKWLIIENMQKITFYRTFLGCIINIILNYLLIPRQGIIGAAIATLSTQAIVNFFFLAFFDKTRITFWMQLKAFVAPIRLIFRG